MNITLDRPPSPPVPKHLQDALDQCVRVGWEVTRSTKSVSVTRSPGRKPMNFSLRNPPTPDQVRLWMGRAGLRAALAKLPPEESPAPTETEPEHSMATTPQSEELRCPECDSDKYQRPASLGVHRSRAHGVKGASRSAQERRLLSAARASKAKASKAKAKKATPKKTAPAAVVPAPAPAPSLAPAAPETEGSPVSTPITGAISNLMDAVAAEVAKETAATARELEQAHREVAELQDFKDKVSAEIANGHQGPIQTLANIIKLGGKGFGTPTA
ncbi:hypothetical protein QFZ75_007970 [Streptomyces sp. V3I8]|uniref:hypothetical protein n=1 Tax=Streptomyces sp. V3I8 TaxID=3042279 RepID=UPI0027897D4E|nr:hypothetical protein [Streptomyces sp. V3I8]MDQ1041468.1 hypothetical protein [Streptomyces sp. V3I8]